jgi:hypothetical protein
MVDVSIVPAEHIDVFWEQVRPLLEPAVEYSMGRYTIEDVYKAVSSGTDILWVAHIDNRIVGAATTRPMGYPQKTMLGIGMWGGEEPLEDWGGELLELIQRYARETGYAGIEGYGRAGWARRLKNHGYKKVYEIFEIPV